MATSLTTRETAGAGAVVKNAPLTNEEVDLNFISITDNKLEAENNLSDLQNASNARSNLGVEIGVDVQSFDANTAKLDAATSNFTGTLQEGGNDVAVYADPVANFTGDLQVSGTSVLIDSDIGSTVQAFDANTAKLDAATSNFTGTLQEGGNDVAVYADTVANFTGDLQVSGTSVLIDSDIGSTVQAFDANILVSGDIGSTVQAFDANNATFDAVNPTFTDTGALGVPVGSQVERPAPVAGQLRFNSDALKFEGYDGSEWDVISGDAEVSVSGGSGLNGSGSFNLNDTTPTSITLDHADTSSQLSVTNSAATVIQNVSLDGFGHVTSLDSKTLSKSDLSLDVNDNVRFDSLGIGTASSGTSGEIRATNNITAFFSDDRLKTRVGTLTDVLSKISTLDAFYFEPNEIAQDMGYENIKDVGVSAQQVQKVLPEIVVPAPIDENYLTVRYEKMVPLLLQAIKELKKEIDLLKEEKNG